MAPAGALAASRDGLADSGSSMLRLPGSFFSTLNPTSFGIKRAQGAPAFRPPNLSRIRSIGATAPPLTPSECQWNHWKPGQAVCTPPIFITTLMMLSTFVTYCLRLRLERTPGCKYYVALDEHL